MTDEIAAMEAAIRNRLSALCGMAAKEFSDLINSFEAMPDEAKETWQYRALDERISSVEALLNTLICTTESFPRTPKETMQ